MKAVVFDMDGVLFDTEALCMDSWIAVAKGQGITDMEQFFPCCIGRNLNDTTKLFREHYGEAYDYEAFRKEASKWFWGYIEEHGMPVKKGVNQILPYLKQNGYRIGLASSTGYNSVLDNLTRTAIVDYFEVLVTGDMIEHSKPRPDIYLLACRKLGVEPGEAYAIEDSPNGIRSAYAAGMKPIMVPDLIAPDEEMKEKVTAICRDLVEVMGYIDHDAAVQPAVEFMKEF